MPHADAFLRAVLADPGDDAPRLIYADWLDEQGDCDRAEFIRVQCALAPMGWQDERRPPLVRRERELLRRHERTWSGALPEFDSGRTFERGFVGSLTLMTEAFLRHAEEVFETAPVRHIKLRGARRHMTALATEPLLARLASLDLGHNRIDMDGATAFFRSPHLGALVSLNVRWNSLGAEGLRALAKSSSLTGLRGLDLEHAVPAALLATVVDSPVVAGLTELSLRENYLGSRAARALVGSRYLRDLRVLDLAYNSFDAAARAWLTERFGADVCRF